MASATSVPAKKPRDNTRIFMWSLVGVAVIFMLYLYAQPTPQAGHTRTQHAGTAAATDVATVNPNAILPEDLTAHFARYAGGKRDPFIPLIATSGSADKQGNQGEWQLTGISSINGVPSALVENNTTGESDFLTSGESWRGLKVKEIGSDAITLVNELGQETKLAFSDTDTDTKTSSGASGAFSSSLPTAGQVRPLPQVGSLPPLPVPANAAPAPNAPASTAQTATPQGSTVQQ